MKTYHATVCELRLKRALPTWSVGVYADLPTNPTDPRPDAKAHVYAGNVLTVHINHDVDKPDYGKLVAEWVLDSLSRKLYPRWTT